jgi:hypothetical protein
MDFAMALHYKRTSIFFTSMLRRKSPPGPLAECPHEFLFFVTGI